MSPRWVLSAPQAPPASFRAQSIPRKYHGCCVIITFTTLSGLDFYLPMDILSWWQWFYGHFLPAEMISVVKDDHLRVGIINGTVHRLRVIRNAYLIYCQGSVRERYILISEYELLKIFFIPVLVHLFEGHPQFRRKFVEFQFITRG